MSYFLRVLCGSNDPILASEIERFIEDGVYFDVDAKFSRFPPSADDQSWENIEIQYDPRKRPIILARTGEGAVLQEELEEVGEVADELEGDVAVRIRDFLKRVHQIIAIEIDQHSLPDDAWVMIDSLEGHLASKYDGIVYAPDDGFFDAALKSIGKI